MEEVPPGWVMVPCSRAEDEFWNYIAELLTFNDVCELAGGAALGPRADGLPDNVVRCPHNAAANYNCVIVTNVF